jgi:hypothetical protein
MGRVAISSVIASILLNRRTAPAVSGRRPSNRRSTSLSKTTFCCTSTPERTARRSIALISERPHLAAASASASHSIVETSCLYVRVKSTAFRLDILLPLFQSLFWAEKKGLFLMDVKPDNLGKRSDGTLAFLDVEQGCVCPIRDSCVKRDDEGMMLIDRQCSFMAMSASAGTQEGAQKKKKRHMLPGALLQGRARGKGGIAITSADLSRFQSLVGQRGGLAIQWRTMGAGGPRASETRTKSQRTSFSLTRAMTVPLRVGLSPSMDMPGTASQPFGANTLYAGRQRQQISAESARRGGRQELDRLSSAASGRENWSPSPKNGAALGAVT